MTEIWASRTSEGVIYGTAVRYIGWRRGADNRWQMVGAFWSRQACERALEDAS